MSLPPHHHITGGHLRQEPLEWPQNQNATGNGQAPTGTSHNFPHPSGHQHATAAQYYQYNSTIGTNIHPSPVVPQRFTTYNYNSSCLHPPPPTAHAHPFYPRTHPAPPHSHQNNNNMPNAAVAQQIPRISIAPTPTTHPLHLHIKDMQIIQIMFNIGTRTTIMLLQLHQTTIMLLNLHLHLTLNIVAF